MRKREVGRGLYVMVRCAIGDGCVVGVIVGGGMWDCAVLVEFV